MEKIEFVVAAIHRIVAQYLHQKSDHKISPLHFPGNLTRKSWLVLIVVCIILSSSCGAESQKRWGEFATEYLRQNLSLTILTINLAGTNEITEKCVDVISLGCAHQTVPWLNRADRIAKWISYNGGRFHDRKVPDVIALQEVYEYEGCQSWFGSGWFGGFKKLADYEVLFTLIGKIEAETGIRYRIAYYGVAESCGSWQGKALLYNSEFLTYFPPLGTADTVWDYDNPPPQAGGLHLRESLTCNNPPETGFDDPCSLIDGKFWTYATYRPSTSVWRIDPIFVRLRLKSASSDIYFHIYNIHVDIFNYDPSIAASEAFIDAMEARYPDKRIYPPILIGDFNVSEGEALSIWSDFEVAGWPPVQRINADGEVVDAEKVGILIGKKDLFPSANQAYSSAQLYLPNDGVSPESFCGDIEQLWSDHCGVFVDFSPVPPSPTPSP